jgi:hypothetical protein
MKKALQLTVPVLENFRPVLHNLDPLLQYLGEYVPELQAFFANVTAASEANEPSSRLPRTGAHAPKRTPADGDAGADPGEPRDLPEPHRHRPRQRLPALRRLRLARERAAGVQLERLRGHLAVGQRPGQRNRLRRTPQRAHDPPNAGESPLANEPGTANKVAAPGCTKQGPFTFNGETSQFPHVVYKEK